MKSKLYFVAGILLGMALLWIGGCDFPTKRGLDAATYVLLCLSIGFLAVMWSKFFDIKL